MIIPDGEWFCPPCQHVRSVARPPREGGGRGGELNMTDDVWFVSLLQKQLCDKLEEQLQNLDAALKKKERAERR